MEERNRVKVHIAGQQISLVGTEEEAYIESIAAYVDGKIQEIQRSAPALSTSNCTLLAAVNIADELFKLRQQYAELDQRIAELRSIAAPAPAKSSRSRSKAPVKHPFEEVEA